MLIRTHWELAKGALLCCIFVLLLGRATDAWAQLPNAWQIDDNTTSGGSLQYVTNLTPAQVNAATNNGWTYTVVSRLVADHGGAESQSMAFGDGTTRHYVFWDLTTNGQLQVHLLLTPFDITTVVASGASATNYHTHQLVQTEPGLVYYYFDGVKLGRATQTSSGQADQVMWGANSSSGMGVMNYHRAEFYVNGQGVLAGYNAGTDGNPPTAPSPTTQGWFRLASGAALSEAAVSPDIVGGAETQTLGATAIGPHGATVFGLLNLFRAPAAAWFEYGTTTNYDNFTSTNSFPAGLILTNVSATLNGLAPATTYHFRLFNSDAAGIHPGNDLTFTSLSTAITLPATNVQSATATLNGSLTLDGLASAWHFDYGLTTNYGNTTPLRSVPAGTNALIVAEPVSGLNAQTTYHCRIVLSNSLGEVTGNDQTFTTAGMITLITDMNHSAVAWADYDGDGLLDLLEIGNSVDGLASLFHNTAGAFVRVPSGITGVSDASVAWADYDNDGRLDLAVQGVDVLTNYPETLIYRNTGNGFTNIHAGLPALWRGSVAWGDYDNDGRPDLLMCGMEIGDTNWVTQIWRNTGNGFTNIHAGLTGVFDGSAVWADVNNDGRLDVLLAGQTNTTYPYRDYYPLVCQFWRNTGNGFTNETAAAGLSSALGRYIAVADYDGDGLLDFALSGQTRALAIGVMPEYACDVWRNTGHGFTNIQAGLTPNNLPVHWGDYDNDGRPDVWILGYGAGYFCEIWRNAASGFTNFNAGLPLLNESCAVGDYNGDGRLDAALSGALPNTNAIENGVIIWPNGQPLANTPPGAPSGLASAFTNGQIMLNWNAATDAQTPTAGLSYNIRVGTQPGADNVVSPEASSDGFRLLPALGNAQLRTNAFLNLPPGTYYWSVQAIDAAYAGGPFAPEASFVVPKPTLNILQTNTNWVISWQPAYAGVVLQQSPRLNPATWIDSPSGNANPVTVPATNTTMFYRLFKP